MHFRKDKRKEGGMKELEYPFDGEYILKKKKSIKRKLLEEKQGGIKTKIAVLGGSTTNDIKLTLELFLLNYGIWPEFYESEYNQFYEDVMFDNPVLREFQPDIVYIHTSNRNIRAYPLLTDSAEDVEQFLEAEYQKYEGMWEKIFMEYQCTIIQNNFEMPYYRLMGNKEASDIHGKINYLTRLNEKIYAYARQHDNFFINDINYLSACYGLERWSDPFYWHMYKYALAVPAIPELSFNVANIIKSIYGKNKKGFVLDLDNTLWGGIVGDDGAENLEIGQETSLGQAYTEFQAYLKEQEQLGIILNVDSKNERENALAGINHPDGILKEDDFICIKANWNPKDQNLKEIASELNLLPESLVFIDDNPAERAIVSAQVPGVAVPEIERVEHYAHVIDRSGFFEMTNFSKDDAKRNEMYKENARRAELKATFTDYREYLLSLKMHGRIQAFEPVYMARIAQLTNKSNQFNLTTKRYTQPEIEETAADKNYITLYGKLEDKFGDNGVVSVVIGRVEKNACHIELWLMSCRVLKRDMEFAMMDTLVKKCMERGIDIIYGYYYPTAKNAMVKDFYGIQGFEKVSEDADGNATWKLAVDEAYENKNTVIKVEDEQ